MKLTVLGLLALGLVLLGGPALAAPLSGVAVRTADARQHPGALIPRAQARWPALPAHRATRASHVVSP